MTATETKTRERPIIFGAPMIRAILDGRKTMTRRLTGDRIRHYPERGRWQYVAFHGRAGMASTSVDTLGELSGFCPYGVPGDRLWVREAWASDERGRVAYRASEETWPTHAKVKDGSGWVSWAWRPSIHMPRWASRITLEITGVRVERLNDIHADDARAEGVPTTTAEHTFIKCFRDAAERGVERVKRFRELWESIHGPDAWSSNPLVWVVEFRRISGPAA